MAHLSKTLGRGRSDPARGTFGDHQVGKARLDGAVALPKCVILGIRDLGLVLAVIEPVVVGDQFGEFTELGTGVGLAQLIGGNVEQGRAVAGHGST